MIPAEPYGQTLLDRLERNVCLNYEVSLVCLSFALVASLQCQCGPRAGLSLVIHSLHHSLYPLLQLSWIADAAAAGLAVPWRPGCAVQCSPACWPPPPGPSPPGCRPGWAGTSPSPAPHTGTTSLQRMFSLAKPLRDMNKSTTVAAGLRMETSCGGTRATGPPPW